MKAIVFAYPGNEDLSTRIAKELDADLGDLVLRQFPDMETYVRVLSNVKSRNVIIVCSLVHPNEKILPLYFLSKTLKSLGAESIILVAPYLSYMRQDKIFNPGEGVTSEYFASLISGVVDRLITVDPHMHRRKLMSEIYSIQTDVIHSSNMIAKYINENINNPLLIGPDSESEQWVSEVAKIANVPFIILEKIRLGDKNVKISLPNVENFNDFTPVLVDDIISTARTMIETVGHLKQPGMKPPVCIGVHGVFSGNAFEELKKSGIKKIITCNTIPHSSNALDITALICKSLDRTVK